jgi:isopenicillin N synthase-like dioxygenase
MRLKKASRKSAKRAIPLVDLAQYRNGTTLQKQAFVKELGKAFHEVGFVGVVNHGIPKSLIDNFYSEAKAFFALPTDVKRNYEVPALAGQRGYTSFGKEHAKQSKVADLKEFFQIGQEVADDHPLRADYPRNVQVAEKPTFTPLGMSLYAEFERTGASLLRAIASYLNLEDGYFDAKIASGQSILRAIHYPPISEEPNSAIRAEQHEDINLITLLVGASAGGLQLLNRDGVWEDVVPEEDEIVINVGDMLQRLTNNYLKSTTHRVVNPPRSEWHLPRLSIPFFMHPLSATDLTCLKSCVKGRQKPAYEPITAGEYLSERLREIGLKK